MNAIEQYKKFQASFPGHVLFFRIGDFYETFYDDATVTAKVLGLTLTKRLGGIRMAGFPADQLERRLPLMTKAGHRVAVCNDFARI